MGAGLAVLFPLPVPYGLVSLSNLAAIFADLVPSINQLAEWSEFPDLIRIWFLVMWLLLPIEIVFIMGYKNDLFPLSKTTNRNFRRFFIYLVSASVAGFAIIYLLGLSIANTNSIPRSGTFRTILTSRVSLGLYGSILLFLFGFSLSGLLTYLKWAIQKPQ